MIRQREGITDGRELPGYKKKSFSLFFGGGEIWFEHLDGLFQFETLVLEKLEADRERFERPSMPSLLCVNLEETEITERIVQTICEILTDGRKRYTRVCFVGSDRKSKKAFKKKLAGRGMAVNVIDDFERAKEWLVSKIEK